jgi:hypothetical protein
VETILAQRLGLTVHVSPLRRRLQRLSEGLPAPDAACLEDWLLEVANARGARVVFRPRPPGKAFVAPSCTALSNEELVVGICQLQSLDRPQLLRVAAQLVSRQAVDAVRLVQVAVRERAEVVLAELARQALRVDPNHAAWRTLQQRLKTSGPTREPILHWTRLAEPVPTRRGCNAACWRLVA